ncbi:MAG: hypothetical protein CM15mP128_0010 [Methanobacteriota archaeon]|nr:MAG: hypothetical protein CM15mP128_0010 [Euryarchaeota archaeon]
MGDILGAFGIKKTGSIRARRQRLYLHLNHDAKALTVDSLNERTKEDLHALARPSNCRFRAPSKPSKHGLPACWKCNVALGARSALLRRDGGRSA